MLASDRYNYWLVVLAEYVVDKYFREKLPSFYELFARCRELEVLDLATDQPLANRNP